MIVSVELVNMDLTKFANERFRLIMSKNLLQR